MPDYSGALAQADALRKRTRDFAVRIIRLYRALPRAEEARIIGRQLLRSGTAVAANYRAVCRARSRAEFVSKMAIVVEEADETLFWLELLVEVEIMTAKRMAGLITEATELLSLFGASLRTAKQGLRQ